MATLYISLPSDHEEAQRGEERLIARDVPGIWALIITILFKIAKRDVDRSRVRSH